MAMRVSLLLTPSGALLIVVLIGIVYLRLVLGEEAFLAAKLGQPYLEYLRAVPRIAPRFQAGLPRSPAQPHWLSALLTEVMPIGAFITIASLPWTYDNSAALLGILISFVASMVARGLMKQPIPTCVFLVIVPATWGFFHLSIARALLVGIGASLVVRAFMLRKPANPDLV